MFFLLMFRLDQNVFFWDTLRWIYSMIALLLYSLHCLLFVLQKGQGCEMISRMQILQIFFPRHLLQN